MQLMKGKEIYVLLHATVEEGEIEGLFGTKSGESDVYFIYSREYTALKGFRAWK